MSLPLLCSGHSFYILGSLQYPAFRTVDTKNYVWAQHAAEHFLRKVCNPRRFKFICSGLEWLLSTFTKAVTLWKDAAEGKIPVWWSTFFSVDLGANMKLNSHAEQATVLSESSPSLVSFSLPFSAEFCGGKGDRHRCYWLQATPLFNTPSPNRMQPSSNQRPAQYLPLLDGIWAACLGFVWVVLVWKAAGS